MPARRGSGSTAARRARATALKAASAMWWLLKPWRRSRCSVMPPWTIRVRSEFGEMLSPAPRVMLPLQVRVLGASDFVPKDYDANRLTFTTAPNGTVSRVFCG